jgi:hypothetical protein
MRGVTVLFLLTLIVGPGGLLRADDHVSVFATSVVDGITRTSAGRGG